MDWLILPKDELNKSKCFGILFTYLEDIYNLKTNLNIKKEDLNIYDNGNDLILNTSYQPKVSLPKNKVKRLCEILTESYEDLFKYDMNKMALQKVWKTYINNAVKDLYESSVCLN